MEEISGLFLALLFLAILVIGSCVLIGIGALLVAWISKLAKLFLEDGERREGE